MRNVPTIAVLILLLVPVGLAADLPWRGASEGPDRETRPGDPATSVDLPPVEMHGNYLGLVHLIHQSGRTSSDPRRDAFDAAANLDVAWEFHPGVRGLVQLQGGASDGNLGLVGNIETTDLAVEIDLPVEGYPPLRAGTLTVGSYDLPFGFSVARLTNNADTYANAVILNDLLYSALGGATGTFNAIGAHGAFETDFFNFGLSLSNGTEDTANNADGNFATVPWIRTGFGSSDVQAGAAYIVSDDLEPSGSTGLGADLTGWILDAGWNVTEAFEVSGYAGDLDFGDGVSSTRDGLAVWMGEAAYRYADLRFAGRLSVWDTDDGNASGDGMSSALPNPGLAVTQGGVAPRTDQKVTRWQTGVTWTWTPALAVKAEWFYDDYAHSSGSTNTDVQGLILALNGRF